LKVLRRASFLSTWLLACCAVACGQAAERPPLADAMPVAAGSANSNELVAPASAAPACVGVEVATEPLPVDLFAALDRSGSMNELTRSGVSKWSATKSAFHDFLRHAPPGMGFGLSLFPVPGDELASCQSEHYRFAAMPIADASQMASGVFSRLDSVTPQGQTPTAPALTAALDLATAYGAQHPERSVVVVLATDGLPTTCDPTDAAALAALAREALDGPAHVRTLVVASGDDARSPDFARIAAAGGTVRPLVIDQGADFARQLGDALGAAAARRVACDLALPEPPAGRELDYDAVNVVLDGPERLTLPRVENASSCAGKPGWYYDIDPTRGAPSRLNVCKAACDRAGSASSLRVQLGCQTITIVK
jgi:hypothetical protein